MTSNSEIKDWYNRFSSKQVRTGVNLRHYTIVNKSVASGMTKSSRVLEIGCGIGTLTGLLNSYLTKGKLVATDISDKSVGIAKNSIKNSDKIDFIVTDMSDFSYPEKFNFVILPDVLEHIPIEQHDNLFKVLADCLDPNGMVLINIPHPDFIDHLRKYKPESLQIIDQALQADDLTSVAYKHGFSLISYESHSIFNESPDYAFIRFRKKQEREFKDLPKQKVIRRKLRARINYWFG